MSPEFEAVERRYNIKLSKYKDDEINDELCDILFYEALRETIAASVYNGGKKIRG